MSGLSESDTFTWNSLPEVTRVDLPCFTHADRAYDMLGGKTGVGVTIRNNARMMKLQFPTQDHLRKPINGISAKSAGMLIRVKPKDSNPTSHKNANDDEEFLLQRARGTKRLHDGSGGQYEVIGRVTKSFNFDQPTDFQFLPGKPSPSYDHHTLVKCNRM